MVLVDLSVESFGRFLKYFMVEKEPPKGKLVCPSCSLSSGYPKKCSRGRLVCLFFTTKFFCCMFLAP